MRRISILILIIAILLATAWIVRRWVSNSRYRDLVTWSQGSLADREALITVQREACPGAPFILPADGFIGLLYADPRSPYSRWHPHQGIDIFSNTEPGVTAVYAAYDGYITREDGWKSTLIQRVPDDPLNPGTQIWLYYTHMADQDGNDFIEAVFPAGTRELFVKQGTLLGYTGNYNGDSDRQVWVHLHFSIIRDDGNGRYTNELDFNNSIDPSPYLGRALNYQCSTDPQICSASPECHQ
ncbi:MAG: M23 family metallopeptidase [Ardenticatenaceae bacterium]|nr:M23 family metallopeptidase [Ardenticatenaceae bacterium]MCB9443687.1 M23 family metallopeptidase [Ardenticatenaceae bacterium]